MSADPCPEGLAEVLRQLVALGDDPKVEERPGSSNSTDRDRTQEIEGRRLKVESKKATPGISTLKPCPAPASDFGVDQSRE
jgi:hypothetical protein